MKRLRHPVIRAATALVGAALSAGCLGTSPGVALYTMSGVSAAPITSETAKLALGVGPIRVPRYLDRPELVTRPGGSTSRLEVDDFSRWAGGFSSNVLSALGENLGARLGTQRVVVYPGEAAFPLDYRVAVDFLAFEGVGGDALVLRANWVIRAPGSEAGPWSGQSAIRSAIANAGREGLVAAHNEALDRLADAIASRIADIERNRARGAAPGDSSPE